MAVLPTAPSRAPQQPDGRCGWKPAPRRPWEGKATFLEETHALFVYLSIYPATQLFIFDSSIVSLGRHQEGKKSEIDTGSFSSGEQAACGLWREAAF